MVTAASLRSQSSKNLAQLAKSHGIPGWHTMRKEQLIRALLKTVKQHSAASTKRTSAGTATPILRKSSGTTPPTGPESAIAKKLRQQRLQIESLKNLTLINERDRTNPKPQKDRLIAIVRDPYWIQAYWEITKETIDRVRVAMADHWFETRPVLRLLDGSSRSASGNVENTIREIPIHGGVRNWYIDVAEPAQSYRLALGYASANNRFFLIAKSNLVTTPNPDHEAYENHWFDISNNYMKYYAMSGGYGGVEGQEPEPELQLVFEEKLRRPMNVPAFVRLGNGLPCGNTDFQFSVDAYLIIQGTANPHANVTVAGEPIKIREDGSFSVKMNLPDKRQVLPVVASSRDGTQQRTTVLAVERNTKVMEPVQKDLEELG